MAIVAPAFSRLDRLPPIYDLLDLLGSATASAISSQLFGSNLWYYRQQSQLPLMHEMALQILNLNPPSEFRLSFSTQHTAIRTISKERGLGEGRSYHRLPFCTAGF